MSIGGEGIDERGSEGETDDGVGDDGVLKIDELIIGDEPLGEAVCEEKMHIVIKTIRMQLGAILKNREKWIENEL